MPTLPNLSGTYDKPTNVARVASTDHDTMIPSATKPHSPAAGSRPMLRSAISHGVLAGAAGTVAHSAVMWLSQQVGQFRQPPQVIIDSVLPAAHCDGLRGGQRRVLAVTSHVGFGIGNGMLFAILHRRQGFRSATAFGLA